MQFSKLFPLVVTEKLEETRAFYAVLGFEAVFFNGWYLHLRGAGEAAPEIAFLQPGHETQPAIFQARFDGAGLTIGLEVADAHAALAKLEAAGLAIALAPRDEPWGQRHFALVDPNGIVIDVIQPIEPDAAWMAGQRDLTREEAMVFA